MLVLTCLVTDLCDELMAQPQFSMRGGVLDGEKQDWAARARDKANPRGLPLCVDGIGVPQPRFGYLKISFLDLI